MSGPFETRRKAVFARLAKSRAVTEAGGGRTVTFEELGIAATLVAGAAAPHGLRGRVALLAMENGADWLAAFLGLRLAGAIIVPVDAGTPPSAIGSIVAALGAAVVFDASGPHGTGLRKPRRDPALLLGKLTSGTTGTPKAFFFTEAQMIADADAVCEAMDIGADDLNHAGLPFGHSYALGNLVLPLFVAGVPLVVASSTLPQVVAAEIARHRPTVFPTVPYLVAALRRSDIAPEKLASLKKVISAGAKLEPEEARGFLEKFGVRVHNFYGSSETGGVAYDAAGDDSLTGESAGTAMRGVSVTRMRDGRLLVSGPAVRTHGNARRRDGFGAQVMPDLGRVDAAGRVTPEGRAGTLVKIGGRRINPAEIERALRSLPEVNDAFVHTIAGSGDEPRLGAMIAGGPADERAVKKALREMLPAWKIPARIGILAAFPVNARGKTDRAALLAILGD